jgi:hypothetical protein
MTQRLLAIAILATLTLPVQAQRLMPTSMVRTEGYAPLPPVSHSEVPQADAAAQVQPLVRPQAKGAGAAIYTQSFASMPTGWTASSLPGSVNGWRWANAAPVGIGNNYPINDLINSTSKGDGWLLYNADSVLNSAGTNRPFGGSITSAAIPIGSTHPNVMLSFQQYFRHSDSDKCFVDVSSNGSSWTTFPLDVNNNLTQYGFLYRNATITTLNISSVVGGQANAFIRFRFTSTAPTYSFNWLIDDVMLYDADAIDMGIAYSGIASGSDTMAGFTRSYGYSSIPLRFADVVYPITYLSNYGLTPAANPTVTAKFFQGNTLVATQAASEVSTAVGVRDSFLVFSNGYKPTAIGGDGVAQNDVDTIRFSVTDSVYASHGTQFTERNCYLFRQPNTAQYWGARFTVSNGLRDTITSVSAAFRPVTAVGERVQAQLYQASGSGTAFSWILLATSNTRSLTAADISTTSNVVMANFPMRVINRNYSPLILSNGDYAIVLTTANASSDVAVYSMVPPLPTAPDFISYQGQSDVSPNDGTPNFAGAGGIATGLVEVPLVHPNFGNARALVAVPETERVLLGAAFPNPANTSINIPVALQQSGTAHVTLSNTVGQVVAQLDLGRMNAGVMQLASIPTGKLPEGVYYYTVTADNGRARGRVVVKH